MSAPAVPEVLAACTLCGGLIPTRTSGFPFGVAVCTGARECYANQAARLAAAPVDCICGDYHTPSQGCRRDQP